MLVALEADSVDGLRSALHAVEAHGLDVRIAPAIEASGAAGEALQLGLVGQDRPGIVNQVTAVLSGLGATIETFRTWISAERHSGARCSTWRRAFGFRPNYRRARFRLRWRISRPRSWSIFHSRRRRSDGSRDWLISGNSPFRRATALSPRMASLGR